MLSSLHGGLPTARPTTAPRVRRGVAPRPSPAAPPPARRSRHAHPPARPLRAVDAAAAEAEADAPAAPAPPRLADLDMKPVLDQQVS
jgi:hypothetical protein